ncbi:MAG: sulfite exporter TauE/SafE family protein [Lachnospiraceae bacterium]|nr:sulfite exporter TauE/SafE family protein [Lachnospiraceae bacterium]
MDGLLTYLLMIIICFGGSFVQRVSGFGFGIFVMLFFPYFMPSHAFAAATSSLLSCFTSIYNAIRQRKYLRIMLVLPMLIASLITLPIAIKFSSSAPETVMKRLLGIVLIGLSIYFLYFSARIHMKPNAKNSFLSGALSGTLSGLFSTGGPPAVIYLLHATSDKLVYFATLQTFFAISNIYSTTVRAINGIIDRNVLLHVAVGLIGCCLGNWIGGQTFDKLDGQKLKRIIYIGMIVSGVLMML